MIEQYKSVMLATFVDKATYATLALAYLWFAARLWNKLSGDRFNEAFARIIADPVGGGIYLGFRFLAFGVVVGCILS